MSTRTADATLFDRHGLFLRRDFLDTGGTPQTLARLLRSGAVHRVRHGAYTSTEQWASLDDTGRHVLTGRAVLRTAKCDAALSHVTAYALHGGPLWDLDLQTVHLTRIDGRPGRREAGVTQHGSLLLPEEVFELDTTRVTSPTRTGIDLVASLDLEHSLVVLDWLLHSGQTTKADLHDCSDRHVFTPGSLHTELAIGLADGRSESVAESRCRCFFYAHGIPMPVPQFEVRDGQHRLLGRVDFAWPGLGVFLEFDGRVKYTEHLRAGQTPGDAVFAEKQREEQIRRATGWRCIRLTWADLQRPEATASYVHRVLSGGAINL